MKGLDKGLEASQSQPVVSLHGRDPMGSAPLEGVLFPEVAPSTRPVADLAERVAEAYAIIDQMLAEHRPTHVIALFSGGHDSLVATHLISRHPAFSFVANFNTTIGIEETRQFVRDVCRDYQLPLKVYQPPVSYRDIVLEHGFPGPGGHRYMYIRLKEKALDTCVREHKAKWKDRIALITGVRLSESVRRMGHVEAVSRDGAKVWTAPIINWSNDDKNAYMALHGLPRNKVVDTICMSGECLCGAFASPGEIAEIREAYPEVAAQIAALEVEVAAAGRHAKWGTRPPSAGPRPHPRQLPLCFSCEARA